MQILKQVVNKLELEAPIVTTLLLEDIAKANMEFPLVLDQYLWKHSQITVLEKARPVQMCTKKLWGAEGTMKRRIQRRERDDTIKKKQKLMKLN